MTTTNPHDFIELLEVFSIALTNGLLDKSEVVKWADKIITSDSEPKYFIIELSLCGHKTVNDIVSLINDFIGKNKPIVSGRVILGFLYRQYLAGKITLRKVVSTINWIVWQADLTNEEKSFMYGLDEDFDCAKDGIYGTIEAVEKETIRFLETYKEFQTDNYNDWKKIDETINNKIALLLETIRQEQAELIKMQAERKKKRWWKLS